MGVSLFLSRKVKTMDSTLILVCTIIFTRHPFQFSNPIMYVEGIRSVDFHLSYFENYEFKKKITGLLLWVTYSRLRQWHYVNIINIFIFLWITNMNKQWVTKYPNYKIVNCWKYSFYITNHLSCIIIVQNSTCKLKCLFKLKK